MTEQTKSEPAVDFRNQNFKFKFNPQLKRNLLYALRVKGGEDHLSGGLNSEAMSTTKLPSSARLFHSEFLTDTCFEWHRRYELRTEKQLKEDAAALVKAQIKKPTKKRSGHNDD